MEGSAPLLPYWSWPVLAAAISAVLTEAAIRYAHRRSLFDQPGQRRMHSAPTPRGGGVGIVAAALAIAALLALHHTIDSPILTSASLGLIAVAAVGAWDDHGGLGALPRLLVHLLAAIVFVGACGAALYKAVGIGEGHTLDFATLAISAAVGVAAVLAIVWSINLHNFMDGINGILAIQTAFLFGSLALLEHRTPELSIVFLCLAAAAIAFVPYNFPRPRVFMGDVGSGALGYLIAVTTIHDGEIMLVALILNSAFIVDTTATLISRFVRGRRWYSAHREHLYQWLARSGYSHAQVVGLYTLWNFCIALPCALIFVHWQKFFAAKEGSLVDHAQQGAHVDHASSLAAMPAPPLWLISAVLFLAVFIWWHAKRWCLRHARKSILEHGCPHAH